MTPVSKKLIQKTIAMIVIAAMLDLVGLSPMLIVFFFLAGFLVWLVVGRSHRREAREVFEFYVEADEILRDEERHWYGFEIIEVVHRGDRVLGWMPDPPPLVHFSLGALQHRAGEYEAAVEHLAVVVETGLTEEYHSSPSPALRTYVQLLRNIEREPAIAPLALGAVRSLELGRRNRAASLLAESRERLHAASDGEPGRRDGHELSCKSIPVLPSTQDTINVPRPISEVLHDVYQDEDAACN
jgi:hypothetical protein